MSNTQASIKKNFIMNVILTMSSFIFPFITFPYISRILLPTGTGKIQFVTSVVTYFNMFAQLGIPTYGIRAIAKVRDDKQELTKVSQELLFINIIMSIIAYIALFFSVIFIPRLNNEKTLYVIIGSTIFLSAIGMEWMYKGLEKYTYITIRSILFKIIAMIAMFILVHKQEDYEIYGAISVFASSASNILNFINARKYINLKPIGNYDFKRHLKPIGTFFAMACATTIYTSLDSVMLGFIKNDYEVGIYNAAIKVKNVLVSLVTSLGAVLLPRASYYVENNMMDDFKKVSSKALNFTFLVSIPLTIYFIIYARQGILLLSGKEYINPILPMQIVMPTLIFIGITNILGIQILIPLGKEKIVLYSVIAGAITDLIINSLLIPKYGAIGAAIGTLVAELVVLIYQYISLRNTMSEEFKNIHYKNILIATILGTIISLLSLKLNINTFTNENINIFITLFITAICFFVTYGLTLLLFKEEMIIEIINMLYQKVKNNK